MKKPCYAAVLSTALIACAPSAAAQADGSVTLYGVVDTGLRFERISVGRQGAASHLGLAPNGSLPSRFGLRGQSPLGNGWQTVFQLESGFNPVNGRAGERLFGRDTYVGLARSGLGSIRLGRLSNISDDYIGSIDPMAESYGIGGADTVLGNSLRTDNTIMVASDPAAAAGFSAAASYSFQPDSLRDERLALPLRVRAAANPARVAGAGMKYVDGPLALMTSYDRYKPGGSAVTSQDSHAIQALLLGAVYSFDAFKLGLAFERTVGGWFSGKDLGFLPERTTRAETGGGGGARRQLGSYSPARGFHANASVVGLTIPAGSGQILTSWQRASASSRRLTGGDSTFNVYSLAYRYDLSTRSALYAYGAYATHYAFLPDVTVVQFGVGMRHAF